VKKPISESAVERDNDRVRVVAYARVSTADQNCEVQLRELRQYAAARGWKLADDYVDQGFSGAKASRPALDRLMADVAARRVDCIIAYKLDRLGRSTLHLSQLLATLNSAGVRVIITSQGFDTDQSNPTSQLLMNVLCAVAQFERELLKERTAAGIRAAKARGAAVGRPKAIFRLDELIRLRDVEKLSWRAIGDRLGISSVTAMKAYPEAVKKLSPQPGPANGRKRAVA
jgi:DNA invertase Pin-like site-specific DNA recombinase